MDKEYAQYILEKTKKDYNLIAEDFSRARSKIWEELEQLTKYTQEGERILDLGCGNGRLLELFEDRKINYTGVDNSEKLIDIAKEKHPEYSFQTADALNLPFPDSYFDKIYSIAVFHHIPSKELRMRFLKEAKRVLKPGGFLFLTVWKPYSLKGIYLKTKFAILKLLGFVKLDFRDILEPWGKKTIRYYHFFNRKELNSLVNKAGFRIKESGILKNQRGNRQNTYIIAEKAWQNRKIKPNIE